MNATKQNEDVRLDCLSLFADLITHRFDINDRKLIVKIILKRLSEYAEIQNSPKNQINGFSLLLVSFLKDNLYYALTKNDFYYVEGIRPFLTFDYSQQLEFAKLTKLWHQRSRAYFLNIISDSDLSQLTKQAFEIRMNDALKKDESNLKILLDELK